MRGLAKATTILGICAAALLSTGCDFDMDMDLSGLDLFGGGYGGGGGYCCPYRIVRIEPDTMVFLDDTVRFSATYVDSDLPTPNQGTFRWGVEDTAVASVDGTGLVRGRIPGWTDLFATHDSTGVVGLHFLRVYARPDDVVPAELARVDVGGAACGLTADGVAVCWGPNYGGQLGIGRPEGGRSTPTPVATNQVFSDISSGLESSCAVTPAGVAYCWGWNWRGALGVGDTRHRSVPTRVHGDIAFGSVHPGPGHTCGLTPEGAAYCWGGNELGQLGIGSTGDELVTPQPVAGDHRFRSIASGQTHTCGLGTDSLAYCWGDNQGGRLGSIARGPQASPTPVAGDHRFTGVAALANGRTCAVDIEGRIHCWGPDPFTWDAVPEPFLFDDSRRYTAIDGTDEHMCALADDGRAYCWGNNWMGQLGDGTRTGSPVPVPVEGGLRFTSISAGPLVSCGRATDGGTYCWGSNDNGQLGTGTLEPGDAPVRVVTLR